MKKSLQLFLLALVALLPMRMNAQSLTVADGTISNGYIPIYGYYADAAQHNQMIFPGSMLAEMESNYITSLMWYLSTSESSSWNTTVTIKMGATTDTALTALATIDTTVMQTVYTGVISGLDPQTFIIFSAPYMYMGGNLLVDITTTAASYHNAFFQGMYRDDASVCTYNGSTYAQDFLPKTTFFYNTTGQVCYPVNNLALTSPSSSSVVATWNAGGSETAWAVRINGGEWIDVTDSTHTFTNLDAGVWQTVEVVAVCGTDDSSAVVSAGVYTLCDAIASLPYEENFNDLPVNGFHPCWTRGTADALDELPYVYSDSYTFPGLTTNYLVLYTQGDAVWAVMPTLDEEIDMTELELTFDVGTIESWYSSFYGNQLLVGVIDSSEYAAGVTLDTLAYYPSIAADETKYISLANYTGTGRNIIFLLPFDPEGEMYGNMTAIDNVSLHLLPQCDRPDSLTVVSATSTELNLEWVCESGTDYYVEYRPVDSTAWQGEDVSNTTITIDNLTPNTLYVVRVRTICGDDTSVAVTGQFRTTCVPVTTFPWTEGFEDENDFTCWTVLDYDNYSYSDWTIYSYNSNSGSNSVYSDYNSLASGTDWLISPALEIPATMTGANLKWYVFGQAWQENVPHYSVRVSTTSNSDTSTFGAPLFQEERDDAYGDPFTKRTISLAQYAGQTIYIAFVRDAADDMGLYLDDISVYEQLAPVVSINGNNTALTNVVATYTAQFEEGVNTGVTYAWHSVRAAAGTATMTTVSPTEVSMLYPTVGPDTLRLIATNSYGSDTAYAYINAVQIDYATIPYSTGFEPTDDVAWTISNGSNGWYIDTAAHHDGAYGLYISSDQGVTNDYNNTAVSNSYAYRAFNFSTAGQYFLSFDWSGQGESCCDYIQVDLVPVTDSLVGDGGSFTMPSTWIALTDNLNTSDTWQNYGGMFELSTPGVYYLVFRWRNDYSVGSNPAGAVDNISLGLITCPAPASLVIDTTTIHTATFHWSPAGSETAWEVTVGDAAPVVVTDTFYTATGLTAATEYAVSVRAICGAGDSSLFLQGSFWTECDVYQTPYYVRFVYPMEHCWNGFYVGNPTPSTSWSNSLSWSSSNYAYSYAPYSNNPISDYLVSPVIQIPATDTLGMRIVYRVAGAPSSNYTTSQAKYEVLVSPTGADNAAAFTDTLWVEVIDTAEFQWRRLPLNNYAGQAIRVAFHSVCNRYAQVALYDFAVRNVNLPMYDVYGSTAVMTGDTNLYRAEYVEGVTTGMTLSWTSTMAAAGQATMLNANTDSMQIVYNTTGVDSITFIATNSFGADTTAFHVRVMALSPVNTLPYMTSFETTNSDNSNWITRSGFNAWTVGTAAHHEGLQALYISNDDGAHNQYDNGTTSVSYASRAFNISTTDSLTISFDWNANGESSFDFLRAFFVPDSLFSISIDTWPNGITYSSSFASAVIPGWIDLGGKLNLAEGWTTQTDTIGVEAPGLYHLVFVWSNDGSVGTNPPAAVDNVIVNNGAELGCPMPVVTAVPTENSIALTINSEADLFEVYYVAGTTWTNPVAGTPTTNANYTITGLTDSTTYKVGVRAMCDEFFSSDWTVLTVTTLRHVCAVPTNVAVSSVTSNGGTITWTAGEEGQDSWQVSITGTNYDSTYTVSTTPTLTVSGLYQGVTYNVKVRGVCSATNYSDWSTPVTLTPTSCERPTGVAVTVSGTSATVTWNGTADRYEVAYNYQGDGLTGATTQMVTGTSVTLTGLDPETAYEVVVRAYCGEVISLWSDAEIFTTGAAGIDGVEGSQVNLYPNPASTMVTLDGIEGEAQVTLVDMNGRVVYTQSLSHSANQSLKIDLTGMAKGAYFVRITGERTNAIRKLIVK